MGGGGASDDRRISQAAWAARCAAVDVRKEDMNRLVMNFLVTEGYVDAARAFADETGTPPGADLAAIADRVAVRDALAAGDVERAVERVNDLDPAILEERPALAFALQRQALIELARGGRAEAALAYAREYLAPRGEDDPRLLGDLEAAVALLAFPDPGASPLAGLLSPAQRSSTAAALNAAILDAQGQAGEARLPGLVRLLAWAQGRLSARGVRFPEIADPAAPGAEAAAAAPAAAAATAGGGGGAEGGGE